MADIGFDFGAAYRLLHVIGEGASGIVWQGVDKRDGSTVAVKLLREQYAQDPDIITRFVTERANLTRLDHPNIVRVRDLVGEEGRLGIVMEYVPGHSLREQLCKERTLAPAIAITTTISVLSALENAHSHDVVHRDVKPDNILLNDNASADPEVKLADFGISKILGHAPSATQMVGTPEYMAPELIENGQATPSIDVYAAGVALYEMLAGRTPYAGQGNVFTIANRHLSTRLPPIEGLDATLHTVLWSMLEKDPARRPPIPELITQLGELVVALEGVSALSPQDEPAHFISATILKTPVSGVTTDGGADMVATNEPQSAEPLPLPELGPALGVTILKTPSAAEVTGTDDTGGTKEEEPGFFGRIGIFLARVFSRKRNVVIAAIVVAVALAAGITAYVLMSQEDAVPEVEQEAASASLEDQPLPSGLIVVREARYEPTAQEVTYTITYKTLKAPIGGTVMESLELPDGICAKPTWDTEAAAANIAAETSIDAPCGWSITLPVLTPGSPATFRATIQAGERVPTTEQALGDWVRTNSDMTQTLLTDDAVISSAYPLQRLTGLALQAPPRIVQEETIPLTVIASWPSGQDDVNPIYVSPSTGTPTTTLEAITGNDLAQVQFADRCAGATAVSADGQTISSLHPATCELYGTIGNFDLEPATITITGYDS